MTWVARLEEPAFWFAIVGFLLAAGVHVATLVGFGSHQIHSVFWLLHIGIFPMWGVAIFAIRHRRETDLKMTLKAGGQRPSWRYGLNPLKVIRQRSPHAPQAIIIFGIIVFYYAWISNFLLIFLGEVGEAAIEGSEFVLREHGTVIRTLTEAEYRKVDASGLRLFSAGWLAFYSMGAIIL